jgi:hypothetical protein
MDEGGDMNEAKVIQRLDRPEILGCDDYRVRSRPWICSTCQLAVTSPEPISVPPQCRRCGRVSFERLRTEPQ